MNYEMARAHEINAQYPEKTIEECMIIVQDRSLDLMNEAMEDECETLNDNTP